MRSSSRWARLAIAVAAVTGLIVACVDQDGFVGPGRDAWLPFAPQFVEMGAPASQPIVHIRLIARIEGTGEEIGRYDEPVDPDSASWTLQLPIDVTGGPVTIVVSVELLNADNTVEWSGRVGPLDISSDMAAEPVPLPIFRGPLENLDVTGVTIANPDTTLFQGDSIHLSANVAGGGDGTVVFWNTSDSARATVTASGLVRALRPDSAMIFAVVGEHADTFRLTILQSVGSVAIDPPDDTTTVGGSVLYTAAALDFDGFEIDGATFTWETSDSAIATIDGAGRATGVEPGTVSIIATYEDIADTASLVVLEPAVAPACSGTPATMHAGSIISDETWTRAGSPHFFDDVDVDSAAVLTIEPGAVLCGYPFAYITFNTGARLDARGSAAEPIAISAADTANPWGGIVLEHQPSDSSWITHATIEYGTFLNGLVFANTQHPVVLEDVVLRHAAYRGAYLRAPGTVLSNVEVQDIRQVEYFALTIEGADVLVQNVGISDAAGPGMFTSTTGSTFDAVTIERTGGDGIYLNGTGNTFTNVRVIDAGEIGLNTGSSDDHLTAASGVRVVGSGSYGFRGTINDLALIAPTAADQDSLLGNGRDTLVVMGGRLMNRTIDVRADVPWRLEYTVFVDSASVMHLEPGAYIHAGPYAQLYAYNGGTLDARGTAADPITITSDPGTPWYGMILTSTAADTSRIEHTLIEHALNTFAVYAYGGHVVLLDSVRIRQVSNAAVGLYSPGSRIARSQIDTTHSASYAAVYLQDGTTFEETVVLGAAGPGISVTGAVSLLGGRVENSGGVGIDYTSGHILPNAVPIRVVGGGSYPARLSISALARMYGDSASQDSLLGNAIDTIAIIGGVATRDTADVRPDLPWRLESTVTFDSSSVLNVLPGASIAALSTRQMRFRHGSNIQALGTPAAPVRFTVADTTETWAGLYLLEAPTDTSRIRNALFEYAGSGGYGAVYTSNEHVVVVDSSRIRRSQYRAIQMLAPGSVLRRSTIDSTAVAGYPAVYLGSGTRFDATTIRGAAGVGLDLAGTAITLNGGRIEGSGDVGIRSNTSTTLALGSTPPRVIGGQGHPVSIAIQPFTALFPEPASQDSLFGNARDTVRIVGGIVTQDTTTVRADLPWRLDGTTYFDSTSALIVEPGATLALNGSAFLEFRAGGTLQAVGTPAEPITFTAANPASVWGGIYLADAPTDTSRIVHALIEHAGSGGYGAVYAHDEHRVRVDDVHVRQSQYYGLYIATDGSVVRETTVDTTGNASYPGVRVIADVTLDGLTVRGAAGTGLEYTGTPTSTPTLRINIYGSGGLAAQMTPAAVWRMGAVEDDTISGNATDRIRVTNGVVYGGTHHLRETLPWQLAGTVTLDSAAVLIADPGAVVYGENGAITFRGGAHLEALGTAAEPVVFTSSDGSNRWGGLNFNDVPADTSVLRHTRVEYVDDGGSGAIDGDADHLLLIDSSTIVRPRYVGMSISASGSLVRETLVDSTLNAGWTAAQFSNDVVLDGLTIRAVAGQGLDHNGEPSAPLRVNIYDAGQLAGEVTAAAAARLTEVEDDTISGNGQDMIRISGGTVTGQSIYMRPSVPFGLSGSVTVGAGASIIGAPGGAMYAQSGSLTFSGGGYLSAIGTAAEPIVFTSIDGTNRWSGLNFNGTPADTSVLRHTRVEYVNDGGGGAIDGDASHILLVDSSAVVRSTYVGMAIPASGSLVRETVVDTTVNAGWTAAQFDNDVVLDGLTIRAAAGQGLDHNGDPSAPLRVNVYDAGERAGELTANAAARLTEVEDDTISGNGQNWMRVAGTSTVTGQTIYMRPSLPLGLIGTVTVGAGASVVALPGAALYADGGEIVFNSGGYLSALGSAAEPIVFTSSDGTNRWSGLQFSGTPETDSTRLRHVRLEYVSDGGSGAIDGGVSHPVALDSVVIERSTYVALRLGSGSISNVTVDTTVNAGWNAVQVTGPMTVRRLRVRAAAGTALSTNAGGVSISECELTNNGNDGVYVGNTPSGVSITTCDISGNGGIGVNNPSPGSGTVIANGNWWGDGQPADIGTTPGSDVSTGVDAAAAASTPYNHVFPQ